jgi:hypothetical protein
VTHSPYARAPDLSVTLSRIAVQYLTLIFHQHTEAKDVITSKTALKIELNVLWHKTGFPSCFSFFFVGSVCLLVRVTVVDKSKAVCCLLATSTIMLSEEKKRKREAVFEKEYIVRFSSAE